MAGMTQGYGAAASDLGLGGMGDSLPNQLAEQEEEARKKRQQMQQSQGGQQYTMTGAGLAAMDLGLR